MFCACVTYIRPSGAFSPEVTKSRDRQIRENKQEVIVIVYNFYADLYKGKNIGLDEIKEYLTHLI